MEFLLILGLAGAAAYLWQRAERSDEQLQMVEQRLDHLAQTLAQLVTGPQDRDQLVSDGPENSQHDGAQDDDRAQANGPAEAMPAMRRAGSVGENTPDNVAASDAPASPSEASARDQASAQEASAQETSAQDGSVQGTSAQEAAAEAGEAEAVEPALAAAQIARVDDGPAHEVQGYAPSRDFSFDFEDIFGRKLPIWGGGFALAVAGIFLVRFSIEAGLMTPLVRVALSFAFGLALLAGAEGAFRFENRLRDPRVRQALAGAGLATLYGAFYLAGTGYGLIGAGAAFIGLAGVTAGAIGLSFRFGLPSAVIGLVGGFAAPLLVNSDSSNVPLLSFYLALVTGGLAWTGQKQGHAWLGYAALAAALIWGGVMIFAGLDAASDYAAVGIYLVVLGTALPAFLYIKDEFNLPYLAAGAVATLQMAILVSDGGFAPLTWALYLLISAALSAMGWRFGELRIGASVAAGVGLCLLGLWPDADPYLYAAIAACQVIIFAGMALLRQWLGRGDWIDIGQLSAVSAMIGAITYIRFGVLNGGGNSILLAAVMGALAAIPGLAFTHIWRSGEELETRKSLVLLGTAYGLFLVGLFIAAPAWAAPVMGLIASVPLLALYARRDSAALAIMAWVSAAIAWLALGVTPDHAAELTQLGPVPQAVDMLRALVRWMSVATIFLGLAWLGRSALSRGVGEAGGVILIYGAIAQAVPSMPLAWIAAAGAIALYLWNAGRKAAWGTALTIAGLWSFVPFAQWLDAGVGSVIGDPFLVISAVTPKDLALKFAPVALAIAVILRRGARVGVQAKAAFAIALGVIAVVAGHSLFKLLFAVGSLSVFVEYGMAERSAWQWLLLICALGAARLFPSPKRAWIALGLVGAGLMHFVWFTAILHNPLWAEQAVGAVPIANWLTPAYLAAIAGLWLASAQMRHIEMAGAQIKDVELDEAERALSSARLGLAPRAARLVCDVATMVLIVALSFSLLRQVFAGSILTAVPIGPSESLVISLLGIVLALGFLAWGSVKRTRSWRIGSLVLMLVAVAKVFLIDAAGLDGLLRIASFMALGFSLIGIGWFYSKQLTRDRTAEIGAEMGTDADAEGSSATQRAQ